MSCSENKEKKFRDVKPKKESMLKKGIGMVQNYASAVASRGIKNTKADKVTKQLRVLSCFGNTHIGGELPPCQYLERSQTVGKHYCGGCGCGDRKATWLMAEGEEYSKLDHPKLSCPLGMPGFSDYKPSMPDESEDPITRKFYIENIEYEEVTRIPVTIVEKQESEEE